MVLEHQAELLFLGQAIDLFAQPSQALVERHRTQIAVDPVLNQALRKQGALPILMDEGVVSPQDLREFVRLLRYTDEQEKLTGSVLGSGM